MQINSSTMQTLEGKQLNIKWEHQGNLWPRGPAGSTDFYTEQQGELSTLRFFSFVYLCGDGMF